ncbi:MAG: protein kinase [Chloroflexi bacterium]|nr:protein kinase [Chloroflexota bacterium]
MNKLVGQQINQYRITSFLDRGGMAEVFVAEDTNLKREVILKIMLSRLAEDQTFAARFRREAQTTARLNHPNIVQIYDTGFTSSGRPFLAMQYIRGGSLHERVVQMAAEGKQFSTAAAISIMRKIAGALHVAHEAGIVHRDLKPSNILLHPDGTPVLTDLGIAAVQTETTQLTQTGSVMGTPNYMSPEQALGKKVDGRSDIYSLGIILYELLAGGVPFAADSPFAVLHQHVYEPPPPLAETRPNLPQHILRTVTICLQKEPAKRFQTARQLVVALQNEANAQNYQPPVQVTPQSPPAPTIPTPIVRSWKAWWFILPLLLLLAGYTAFQLLYSPEKDDEEIESIISSTTVMETITVPTAPVQVVDLSPTDVPPTDLPPTEVPATAVPPTDINTPTPLPPLITADVSAIRLHTPPTIDGNLSDWPQIRAVSSAYFVYQYDGWDGLDDVNAFWYLGWDSANLYLAVIVTDDSHVQTQSDVLIYKGDSVELQFDTDIAGDFGANLSPDDFQLLLSPGDFNFVPQAAFFWQGSSSGINELVSTHHIVLNSQATANGYVLEAALPWQDLSLSPTAGLRIGLALNVSDNDVPGTAVQELLKSNVETRTYLSPATWGTLTLQE